jgi:hypothetical protein
MQKLCDEILSVLTNEPRLAVDIALDVNLTRCKVLALLRFLVQKEKVKITEVRVKGKGTFKAYSLKGAE